MYYDQYGKKQFGYRRQQLYKHFCSTVRVLEPTSDYFQRSTRRSPNADLTVVQAQIIWWMFIAPIFCVGWFGNCS